MAPIVLTMPIGAIMSEFYRKDAIPFIAESLNMLGIFINKVEFFAINILGVILERKYNLS